MAHQSEHSQPLECIVSKIATIACLDAIPIDDASVYLLNMPFPEQGNAGAGYGEVCKQLLPFFEALPPQAVVCLLTSPQQAAALLPTLEPCLVFQLWVALKTNFSALPGCPDQLPARHAALLVLSRYRASLKHTKTRIGYSYCPACHKTTKDYGGKKHVYHEFGTLLSDVWRDIELTSYDNIEAVTERLGDLFGLPAYSTLRVLDLRDCAELLPEQRPDCFRENRLALEWADETLPLNSQLINQDCLEALRALPANSLDFCFADPPYNIEKKYDSGNDSLESSAYFQWCDAWLSELARVLKPGRTLAVLNIPLWAVRHYQHLATQMNFQSWIVWEALGLPVRMIMPSHYAILCFSKGPSRPLPGLTESHRTEGEDLQPLAEFYCVRASCIARRRQKGHSDRGALNDLWYDIHRLKHNTRRVDHPCQLPPALMRRLYALFTNPDESVLDCFNGAGTSTLVAQQMGRRFIGIELSEPYHQLALERHAQLTRGEDPFGKNDNVPKAKNSRVERLPKQKYQISKKTLQLEVKRIAQQLERLPTREEVEALTRYPMEYYDQYFLSWGEVCAAARTTGMSELPIDARPEQEPLLLFP